MRKIALLLVILLLCALIPSCTSVPEQPTSGKEIGEVEDSYRRMIYTQPLSPGRGGAFFNNLLYTSMGTVINLAAREMFVACSDPLCNHSEWTCATVALKSSNGILISPNSAPDDLVFYLGERQFVGIDEDRHVTFNHRILRYHFYTGDLSVLAENLPSEPSSFCIDPWTENLFFQQRVVNEAGETEASLYILNGKTGKLEIIPTPNIYPSVRCAIGDVVYFTDPRDGMYYSVDLSQKERVVMEAEEPVIDDTYRFYEDNPTEVQVPVPDELLPLCEEYGKKPYKTYTKHDLYRVKKGDKNATPELVAKDISYFGYNDDYVFYCEFDPKYVIAYYLTLYHDERGVRQYQTYPLETVDVPQNADLVIDFEEYYAPIHVLDAKTLEEVAVIASEGYYIQPQSDLELVNDGIFVTWKYLDPQMYLRRLTGGSDEVQKTFGYLYFDKHDLTYEDTVVFRLSEDEH